MSDQDKLNLAEQELEAGLRSLTPVAMRLDPVAAAYCAGQRSAQREAGRWRFVAAAMALLGAGAWLFPLSRDLSAGKPARVQVIVAGVEAQPVSQQSMVMLKKTVWQKGVDGLAPVQLAPSKIMHIDEINPIHKGET